MECISISFKTAPEGVRNCFSFTQSEKEHFLSDTKQCLQGGKCIILCTCNRTEIYTETSKSSFGIIEDMLEKKSSIKKTELHKFTRYYQGKNALKHLFKVACGLDSMVIGENEILSQVKLAYQMSADKNQTGYELNTAFLGALACAKKIKTQTSISKSAVSIATLACKAIRDYVKEQNICEPSVLLLGGSGKTGTAVIKNLLNKTSDGKNIKISATKRIHGISVEYDKFVNTINYTERYEMLKKADIILSATQSPHYTLTYEETLPFVNDEKKRLFIDIASPYDIDREIANLPHCTLITIDQFEKLARENNLKKQQAITDACDLIDKELQKVRKNLAFHNAFDSICEFKKQFNDAEQILFYLKENLDADSFEAVLNCFNNKNKDRGVK